MATFSFFSKRQLALRPMRPIKTELYPGSSQDYRYAIRGTLYMLFYLLFSDVSKQSKHLLAAGACPVCPAETPMLAVGRPAPDQAG